MTFGEIIPGLKIDGVDAPYPVVNERAVRATAGLMFLIGISTFFYVFYTKDFTPVYYVVPAFWLDFFLKTVFGPKYSVFGFIARNFVKGQRPEYVGAFQKRFAWGIGLTLASLMMIGPLFMGVRGIMPLTICSICLFFMWLETSFGICAGCKIYGFLLKKGIMKEPEFKPACPGGACAVR